MVTIGHLVWKARIRKGISRKELSQRMGCSSVSTITKLEKMQFEPTAAYLHKISDALGITIDKLLPAEWLPADNSGQMTPNSYQREALRTASGMTDTYPMALNGVLGLAGESGECVDMMKKHLFQGHLLDREQMAKELGDVAWYLAVTAHAIGYDLETVLAMNVEKLRKRYPDGFEVERSLHRAEGDT